MLHTIVENAYTHMKLPGERWAFLIWFWARLRPTKYIKIDWRPVNGTCLKNFQYMEQPERKLHLACLGQEELVVRQKVEFTALIDSRQQNDTAFRSALSSYVRDCDGTQPI